jgi:hypothetical protein
MLKPKLTRILLVTVGACLLAVEASAGPMILDGNEQAARTASADTIFYDNEFPILNIRDVSGDPVIVEGTYVEDIFSYESTATEVVVTIVPPNGDSITVTANSGPTWYENAAGEWEATFTIPSPGGETNGSFDVELASTSNSNTGNFKIKKSAGSGGT